MGHLKSEWDIVAMAPSILITDSTFISGKMICLIWEVEKSTLPRNLQVCCTFELIREKCDLATKQYTVDALKRGKTKQQKS